MLEYAGSFIYINNQGYILEVSNEKLDVPIIEGYTTNTEELQVANRLNKEDLTRLEMILKIVEFKESNEILEKINRINIEDKQNYTLKMESLILHLSLFVTKLPHYLSHLFYILLV